ncbi:hypothetical protein [Phytomonospora endophytica]|uniref:DUF308 domain-containing protein n=1 Tax=Phytomonospora endophytica TaxID=714109 RepID=A0A841FKJ7_9ACTN|nr:hypothetical protein [Phytomonospora endophytica]MBB6033687.1 hypothetical protein [Phytomonospora endophytica]GIG64796.1 hypothetical protein Pen01_10910 [Phytomonospora endophytica]
MTTDRPEEEPDHKSEDGLSDADLSGDNLERRFSELIAGLDSPKWPEEEPDPAPAPVAPKKEEPTLLELWDADLPEDEEEAAAQYDPPPPPPVPKPSRPAIFGLVLIVAGVVLFLQPTLLGLGSDVGILLGAATVLAGVGVLIWRLRPGDEEDPYDPDDGAVV